MKKLILTLTLVTFLTAGAAFAGCWKSHCVCSGMCSHWRQSTSRVELMKQMKHNRMCHNHCSCHKGHSHKHHHHKHHRS